MSQAIVSGHCWALLGFVDDGEISWSVRSLASHCS